MASSRSALRDLLEAARLWRAAAFPEKATSAAEDYDIIRADFVNRLTDAFQSAVSTNGRAARNAAGRALAEDIPAAFGRGYSDAGGGEPEDDDDAWVTAKQAEQLQFMADAITSLRGMGENITEDIINARVELWAGMLDGVYSEGKLRGSKNMLCYFDGDDGAESCQTCQDLKDGPPRTVKYILAHHLVPQPGNENFECGCWKCEHHWFSVKTDEQVTL